MQIVCYGIFKEYISFKISFAKIYPEILIKFVSTKFKMYAVFGCYFQTIFLKQIFMI